MKTIVDTIAATRDITLEQLQTVLSATDTAAVDYLYARALETCRSVYGNAVFMRGLIEVSNHCKNDCLYCGIRRSHASVHRYRLSEEQVLECCATGYRLGFRTFVLQGGEDGWFSDTVLCHMVQAIRNAYPDCAITLSLGERSRESYRQLFEAGANRYLLRHETANAAHYASLHPAEMSFDNRMRCLQDLKEIGYQVGCGFMVGSPGQTVETLFEDLQFIRRFEPQMVGIGPFIPASGTPFENEKAGSVETTLRLLAIIRLLHPRVLLPATTALGTLHPRGRERGILAGANVVMPNLSPKDHRKDYALYDNKLCTGDEAAECRVCLDRRIRTTGSQLVVDRGDFRE
ncbi:MAG: [FeFe] hydrogenase H-cluster radical SAM maturase HydE [Bacteroidales bacterium]|nr:[FeFe] hydrogenase H-cluster radical SAM maturase HydE [Bacteroidales bacterium]